MTNEAKEQVCPECNGTRVVRYPGSRPQDKLNTPCRACRKPKELEGVPERICRLCGCPVIEREADSEWCHVSDGYCRASLLEKVDRLDKMIPQGGYCPECKVYLDTVDEDGCCLMCGADALLIGWEWANHLLDDVIRLRQERRLE